MGEMSHFPFTATTCTPSQIVAGVFGFTRVAGAIGVVGNTGLVGDLGMVGSDPGVVVGDLGMVSD